MLRRLRRITGSPPTGRWLLGLVGIAVAAASVVAGLGGGIAATVCVAAVGGLARWMLAEEDRRHLVGWIVAATAVRIVIAAVLHLVLLQRGPYGNLFLDDAGYVQLGIDIARYWLGQGPQPFIDPSYDHNYIKAAGAVFALVGPNVLALKVLNTFFGVAGAMILFRIARAAGLPGARTALAFGLVFPSLVLWSALALKDSFANFFCLLAVWGVIEFARSHRARWFVLTIAALLVLENVRPFLFVILCVSWPVAMLISARGRRLGSTALAGAVALLLLVSTSALNYLDPNIITASAYIRSSMAFRASSGFVVPLPVIRAEPCSEFVVTVPDRTPVPGPVRHDVPMGTELVVEVPGSTPRPGVQMVRPGDIVALAGATPCPSAIAAAPKEVDTSATPAPGVTAPKPSATATPTTPPPPVRVALESRNIVSTPPPPQTQDSLKVTTDVIDLVKHLPIGIYALVLLPFPPLARSASELAATPEMLAWYALLALALVGMARVAAEARARLAYALIVAALVAAVLVLFEGNTGTLLRHRAMLIPFLILLAGVGADQFWRPARR